MIRNARRRCANARDAGEDERPAPDYVNIIELGTGDGGARRRARVHRKHARVRHRPRAGGGSGEGERRAERATEHATCASRRGRYAGPSTRGSVPDPGSVFLDTIDAHRDETETKKQKKHNQWHFVAACETLYWGGWDVFDDDTRAPQLATMVEACAGGAVARVVAFTVRDERREKGFALNDIGGRFGYAPSTAAFSAARRATNHHHALRATRRATPRPDRERADARARAYVAGASEGDLLVFRGRLKERHVAAWRRRRRCNKDRDRFLKRPST